MVHSLVELHHNNDNNNAQGVCVCVLLFLLSIKRLETELLLLGVDALADPIHALLEKKKITEKITRTLVT